jgi:hypothetical protein
MSVELALLPIAIAAIGAIASRKRAQRQAETSFSLETRMTDPRILQAALGNCGCQSVATGAAVDSAIEGARIIFEPRDNGALNAAFFGAIAPSQAEEFIASLYGEYTRLVQQDVYQKVIERAAAKGLSLESEEIQQDDSIVLTFCVQE